MNELLIRATGTLRTTGAAGGLVVHVQHPRQKAAKDYAVRADVIRPAGQDPESLDGVTAEVTWDRGTGAIVSVAVRVSEAGPIRLPADTAGFLNPYAFVPIPDRELLPLSLDDHEPAGHDRYLPDRWSGTIAVTLTTRTPLLIPDHAHAVTRDKELILPIRVDHLRRPILAGSAVKGALRSAYEAVTNSRFGIFGGDERLAMRAAADRDLTALQRPAVVTAVTEDGATISYVASLIPEGQVAAGLREPIQTAVWVPRSLACATRCRRTGRCAKPGKTHCAEPRGRQVDAWIYFGMLGKFPLWRVATYAEPGKLGPAPARTPQAPGRITPADHPYVKVRGRLHWTGSSFPAGGDRKHDERMVVEKVLEGPAKLEIETRDVDRNLLDGWRAVIDSYEEAHATEAADLVATKYGGYVTHAEAWRDLTVGDTLYIELDKAGKGTVVGLYPAMIGRKPFPGPPRESLPARHRPATDRTHLSPADRVFGWVRQGSDDSGVAYRGHLRVIPPDDADMPPATSVQTLSTPLRLVTLNSPKPSQVLFYLGDKAGAPRRTTSRSPDDGYPAESGRMRLRGRKVYLTHAEVLDHGDVYWTPPPDGPQQPIDIGGRTRYHEYAATPDAKSAVSTSISQWIRPGTTFRIDLVVDNLSDTELGALLWLLTLPDGAMLKLGLGKPLGFGAVRADVTWEQSNLYTGEQLVDRYRTLGPHPAPTDAAQAQKLAEEYDALMREHLPEVRSAFLTAARGLTGAPVHYPRLADPGQVPGTPSKPRATTYDWWVENNKVGAGQRIPLGELAESTNLPLPYQPSNGSGGDSRGQAPPHGRPQKPGQPRDRARRK